MVIYSTIQKLNFISFFKEINTYSAGMK